MQDVILQHADRLVEYTHEREKAIGLIDARERLKDPDAMGVAFFDGWSSQQDLEVVNVVTSWGTKCHRCEGWVTVHPIVRPRRVAEMTRAQEGEGIHQ